MKEGNTYQEKHEELDGIFSIAFLLLQEPRTWEMARDLSAEEIHALKLGEQLSVCKLDACIQKEHQ